MPGLDVQSEPQTEIAGQPSSASALEGASESPCTVRFCSALVLDGSNPEAGRQGPTPASASLHGMSRSLARNNSISRRWHGQHLAVDEVHVRAQRVAARHGLRGGLDHRRHARHLHHRSLQPLLRPPHPGPQLGALLGHVACPDAACGMCECTRVLATDWLDKHPRKLSDTHPALL